jgi:hypothetical protein
MLNEAQTLMYLAQDQGDPPRVGERTQGREVQIPSQDEQQGEHEDSPSQRGPDRDANQVALQSLEARGGPPNGRRFGGFGLGRFCHPISPEDVAERK